jgi:hypothetical protein
LASSLVIAKLIAVFIVLVASILQELVACAAIEVIRLCTLHIVVALAVHIQGLFLAI